MNSSIGVPMTRITVSVLVSRLGSADSSRRPLGRIFLRRSYARFSSKGTLRERISAGRGIGTYALGLLQGLISQGFDSNLTLLLDADFPEPSLPAGGYKLAGSRRRYHGQLSAYEEAVALGSDLQRIRPDVYHAI